MQNENMSTKTPNMNISPNTKERRPFQFFRSRTLSSSSTGSNEGGGVGGVIGSGSITNIPTTSPRVSPRSIFEKVRKRSGSDVKTSNSIDHINGSLTSFQQNLQKHLQDQLYKEMQQKAKIEEVLPVQAEPSICSNSVNIIRKNLSHSISEEGDDDDDERLEPQKHKLKTETLEINECESSHQDIHSIDSRLKMSRPIVDVTTANNRLVASGPIVTGLNNSSLQKIGDEIAARRRASSGNNNADSPNVYANLIPKSSVEQLKKMSQNIPPNVSFDMSRGFALIENNQIFSYFMKHKFCYDIMPKSAKVVVFDTQLLVKKAFFALIYNGVRSAPLWDSTKQKYIGMLTITDFILILQKYYREANAKIEELEDHKLSTWRDVLKEYSRPFVYLTPEDTLYDAIRVLCINKVHRLPIIDTVTGNVVCIVTHKRILRYLYLFIYDMPQPDFLQKSLTELKLGTYENIRTIVKDTTLTEALNIFVESRVSALPVVDENKKLVNIYSKFDVIDLAANKTYNNLNVTVIEALQYRNAYFDGVCCCTKDESLATLMERIVKKEVHRLVIVDEQNRVTGILSLSDILTFIVLKQEALVKSTTSMTAAFGLTRLSSNIDVNINNSNGNNESHNGSQKRVNIPNSGGSSIDILDDTNSSSMSSANSSPLAATVQQPQITSAEQAIFEDDPMEISDSTIKIN